MTFLSQLTNTSEFPDFLSLLPIIPGLTPCWSPRAGRGQAEQRKRVQEDLVKPAPAGVQGAWEHKGALAAGVDLLRDIHL